ncbi:hypothetical protein ACFX1Q_042692 [Malus domestica]
MWSSNGEEGLGWMSQRQRRLILGEPELLPTRLAILFVVDATRAVSLEVEIIAVGVSLAPPAATLDTMLLGEEVEGFFEGEHRSGRPVFQSPGEEEAEEEHARPSWCPQNLPYLLGVFPVTSSNLPPKSMWDLSGESVVVQIQPITWNLSVAGAEEMDKYGVPEEPDGDPPLLIRFTCPWPEPEPELELELEFPKEILPVDSPIEHAGDPSGLNSPKFLSELGPGFMFSLNRANT